MRVISFFFFLLLSVALSAQHNPISWDFEAKALGNNEYELRYTARVADGWTIYSALMEDGGPIPTAVSYDSKHQELVGKFEERTSKAANRKEEMDEIFEMNVIKYKKDLTLVQRVRVTDKGKPVEGYVTCQACDHEKCLPPTDTDFAHVLANLKEPEPAKNNTEPAKTDPDAPQELDPEKKNDGEFPQTTIEENPETDPTEVDSSKGTADGDMGAKTDTEDSSTGGSLEAKDGIYNPKRIDLIKSLEAAKTAGFCADASGQVMEVMEVEGSSFLQIFIWGFLGGFVALLTPCVFPMVPLTVSYFTKRKKKNGKRDAFVYAASIVVIYVALGLLITGLFGGNALNLLSTHWIPNLLFFVLFVVFAISFFGYFEIKLPSSWSNKSDQAADKGGFLGIFFMAFTLALVSFSCTGPIIGTLLVEAADGGQLAPAVGMFGFSLALALPFGLFSAFPSWLQSLPKSGGWMTTIKVVLGFIELGLAFKFLSKADLTEHWGILKYESFLIAVTACALGLGLYLFGLIRFPHDDPKASISLPRKGFAALSIATALYFASGFMTHPLTKGYHTPFVLSGIAPPACYSYFKPCDCPSGINDCFKSYEEGLAYAKEVGKPVLLDFTGHGCENCRKMEDNVWSKEDINAIINNKYVLVSLYVDDREPLDPILKTPEGQKLRTVGSRWAAFQTINFKENTQPLYVLMSAEEEVLVPPVGYTPNAEQYKGFLNCGLNRFAERQKN